MAVLNLLQNAHHRPTSTSNRVCHISTAT